MKFLISSAFFAILVIALFSGCEFPGKTTEDIAAIEGTGSNSFPGDAIKTVRYRMSWTEYTGNCGNYNIDSTTLKSRTISTVAIAYCPSCVLRFRNWVVSYGSAIIENPYSRVTKITRTGESNVFISAQYYTAGG